MLAPLLLLASLSHAIGDGLAAPFCVKDGASVIDVDVGHAAPLVADFDGDGVQDLLLGQFGEGKLRVYKNVGTVKEPKFAGFTWFRAGGEDARIPSG